MFLRKSCQTGINCWRQDYRTYRLSKREALQYAFFGFLGGSLLFYFFYRTVFAFLIGIPCAVVFCKWQKKCLCKRRKQALQQQFKDWIRATASELQAGYSVENAFIRAGRELRLMYEEETDIRREMRSMEHLLANNMTAEKILADLAERSEIEDICNFADAFAVGKRSGGDLKEMIENCCEVITMKTDVEKEILTLLHGRQMEQRIMQVVPFAIISYITLSSPGYFDPLYHNLAGICIMTVCLLVYLFAVVIGMQIVRIEI